MNWKNYEKEILTYFQETYPDTKISFDQSIVGKYSKVHRQIDILIEGEVAGYEIRIVVDCKHFSKNIDVKQVESFCSMVEDVEAHQGVLITQKGYSTAAINRAYYGNHKVELDIINLQELKEFQSYEALPYAGHFCVIVPSPFGWVLDLKDKINAFATLHQRGITLKEAQKRREWMYMQFWKLEDQDFTIDNLIEIQNENILQTDNSTKFTYNSLVKRDDGYKTKIRIAEVPKYPALEVTGFIQFETHIFFIVLFTPKELLNKNIRKLQRILKVAKPAKINFDNHEVINQLLSDIELTNNREEKADIYNQIGIWYKEMDDIENAMINFRKSLEYFPEHYTYLKDIINETLSHDFDEESKKFSKQLFDIQPKNPRIPQDLIEIYLNQKKGGTLIDFFKDQIQEKKDDEVLGNLSLHLGLLYFNTEDELTGKVYIGKAKELFKKVFPSDHYVFESIATFESEINGV